MPAGTGERPPFRQPATLLSTCFGIGYMPFAPGTAASIVAVPLAWLIAGQLGPGSVFVAGMLVLVLGLIPAHIYARQKGEDDPSEVVIDELAGQWLALSFANPEILWHYGAGFVLFRLFDILKPWPVNWAERLPGGWGVMLDDLVAAFYAAAITYGGIWLVDELQIRSILEHAG